MPVLHSMPMLSVSLTLRPSILAYVKIDSAAKLREAQFNVDMSENWVARKRNGTPLSESLAFISVKKSFRFDLLMVTN
jgi:hypothetical protein